ncbi:hypothetical protein BN946_scf184994.g1 [Trametes cinnabarina]|uniref:Uncharacterized protein n=1 Tax=Pycnoporus cinnabarinus TaxID=5643 RepID=A0A060SKJ7_PYCCI|nr:hypothetical protein BN946_scf184994.g1 [Trametes cinnabarina]
MSTHDEIIAKLPEAFEKARVSGDLLFFPSTIHVHREHDVDNKPKLPPPDFSADAPTAEQQEKKRHDPFAPPYVPNLYLGEVRDEAEGNEYVILFNKYSIVPNHILMVTKEFQSQSSPLMPPDLVQAYLFLVAAKKAGRNFFAFYNCKPSRVLFVRATWRVDAIWQGGDLSGASQPHKHLQLIPIEDDGPPIEKVARAAKIEHDGTSIIPSPTHQRILTVHQRPPLHAILPALRQPHTPTPLLALLPRPPPSLSPPSRTPSSPLLDLAISTVRHDPTYPQGSPSYNVILTLEHIHVVPRRRETHTLARTGEALSVNALGFAGMLLVKSEAELGAVKEEGVGAILRGVGLESVHELQMDEHKSADERL